MDTLVVMVVLVVLNDGHPTVIAISTKILEGKLFFKQLWWEIMGIKLLKLAYVFLCFVLAIRLYMDSWW